MQIVMQVFGFDVISSHYNFFLRKFRKWTISGHKTFEAFFDVDVVKFDETNDFSEVLVSYLLRGRNACSFIEDLII